MPRGFDDQEIRDVADRLVRSVIRRPHDALGVRRTDLTFGDVREGSASVFLLHPKAPYAVAELCRQKLAAKTTDIGTLAGKMAKNLSVLRRRTLPVRDLSSLANARSALIELEGSVRSSPPRDVTLVPSYVRFDANLRRFLEKSGGNVRGQGELVPTPTEARASLRSQVGELQDLGEALLAQALLLSAAIEDYGKLGLPQIVAGNVVAGARTILSGRLDDLEGRSESGRLAVLKQTVLELLAMRGVVRQFGSFTPPSAAYDLEGQGSLFADQGRPRVAPSLAADKPGPYAIVPGTNLDDSRNTLRAWLDGVAPPAAPTVTLFLPTSVVPQIQGTASGPFLIDGSNNELYFKVGGITYPIELDSGTLLAADVVANLNAGLAGSGFKGEAYFAPLFFDGEAVVAGNVLTPVVGIFPPNSVDVGYEVDFYLGPNANLTRSIMLVGGSLSAPTSITVSGAPLTAGPGQRIRYGTSARRVRVVPIDPAAAVTNRVRIDLDPQTDAAKSAGFTLGMFGALVSRGRPTDASVLADFINQAGTGLAAEAFLEDPIPHHVRTDPLNGTRLVAYEHYGRAAWTAGTTVTVTFEGALEAAIGSGHAIVLREGMNPNALGTVLARVSDTVLTAFFVDPVSAASGLVEVGSASFSLGQILRIESGPLAGDYHVEELDPVADFQCIVREFLPVFRDAQANPFFAQALQGDQGLGFQSRTKTLQAAVEVVDPLGVFFNLTSTNKATAKTRYVKLPEVPTALEEDDILERFQTNYETPDESFFVTRIFSDGVVQLDGLLTAPLNVLFGAGLPPPFFRLRAGNATDFETLSKALASWSTPWKDGGIARFFKNYQRLLNPLLVNENPTDSQVGAAEEELTRFAEAFAGANESLAQVLTLYTGPEVGEVTSLFRALREKGADRAVDILLACRFRDFFGLDQEGTSYSGAMQSAVRDVARLDLPVRKTNRAQSGQGQLIASADSTDFEYSAEDLDTTEIPDPTVDFS